MFAKVFSQIFTSSISKDRVVRYGFMDLLVLADRDGVVDMTSEAIARITNVPTDVVAYYLAELQKPDTESRTPSEDGCRIVLLSDHRNWGWKIVNYHHYRELRSEDDRREYMRSYMRKRRVNSSKQMLAPLAKAEADTDTDTEAIKKPSVCLVPHASELAELLVSLIHENNPKAKITESQHQAWAKEADKLLRIDKREYEEAESLLRWALADSFWAQNILSIGKFRKQYDQLWLKRKNGNGTKQSCYTEFQRLVREDAD